MDCGVCEGGGRHHQQKVGDGDVAWPQVKGSGFVRKRRAGGDRAVYTT